jgi:cbb3-type cytochrome oxidase maturation protein
MTTGFLIPLSLAMGLVGLAAFFWALRSGQFDDPEGDAHRVLIPQPPLQGERHVRLDAESDHENPLGRL